jgi:hypothetical protein
VQQSSRQQAEADHAVHHNHDDCEHRVARQGWVGDAHDHDGRDEGYFYQDHREGEDERAQRLAQQLGQRVGMTDDAEDAQRDGRQQPDEQNTALRHLRRIGQPSVPEQKEQEQRRGADDQRRLAANPALPVLLANLQHRALLRPRSLTSTTATPGRGSTRSEMPHGRQFRSSAEKPSDPSLMAPALASRGDRRMSYVALKADCPDGHFARCGPSLG